MEHVIRALSIYAFLWLILKLSGRRTLSEISTFDFVLLLVVAECAQQALVGPGYSLTVAAVLIVTLVGADVMLSFAKFKSKSFENLIDGAPLVILKDGQVIEERLQKERIDAEDILVSARRGHGLTTLDQIKYAVLEPDGSISIIPKSQRL